MTKRKKLTAEEFAEALKTDTRYQDDLAHRARHAAVVEREGGLVIADLARAGVDVSSLEELESAAAGFSSEAVEILLRWLPKLSAPSLQTAIVRCLASVDESFDIQPLLALYASTSSASVRWAIGNAIAEIRPLEAKGWVIDALARTDYGRAREMLPLALARIAPSEVANVVLMRYLEEMPGHVAMGLAESGGNEEARRLTAMVPATKGWVRKEIQRAIRSIERRVGRP